MSRLPTELKCQLDEYTEEASDHVIKASIQCVTNLSTLENAWVLGLAADDTIPNEHISHMGNLQFKQVSNTDFLRAQDNDPIIGRVKTYKSLRQEVTKEDRLHKSAVVKLLMKDWNRLIVGEDGVLRRNNGGNIQLVLAQVYHSLVFKEWHHDLGHLGSERVSCLARTRFYWPKKHRDIYYYISKVCQFILQNKPTLPMRAPLQSITTLHLLK